MFPEQFYESDPAIGSQILRVNSHHFGVTRARKSPILAISDLYFIVFFVKFLDLCKSPVRHCQLDSNTPILRKKSEKKAIFAIPENQNRIVHSVVRNHF